MRRANEPWLDHITGERKATLIGPIEVPWEMRKFIYRPSSGSFRTVLQDFKIAKRTHKVVDGGFRDGHISQGPDKVARHSSGSPVFTFAQVTEVHEMASEKCVSIGECLLVKLGEWGISVLPEFADAVREGKKAIPDAVRKLVADGKAKYSSLDGDEFADKPTRKRKPRRRLQTAATEGE